jgi:transcriptional regulator with XRE-family HTH domain
MARLALEEVSLLESLRVDRGLTIRDAADQAGVAVRTLMKYESGERDRPHGNALEKLARFYGVRSSVLLNDMRKTHRRWLEAREARDAQAA